MSVVNSPEPLTLSPARTIRDVFPPVRKSHILNCSYPKWHATYRSLTPKSRIIPLTPEFLAYLREDGIILPSDEERISTLSGSEDSDDGDDTDSTFHDDDALNPVQRFPELHQKIKDTIRELGGRVSPKLNWSSPKDATFMTANNTSECRSAGDIYLLFKSSDYITYDLEYAFDDCVDDFPLIKNAPFIEQKDIEYSLVLRKWFQINPSMEFRCFVRGRRLIAISQRELNHFDFLQEMKRELLHYVNEFFEENFKHTFPDCNFVFDIYIPVMNANKRRTWLIDINPFAPRTDPLLFSWLELLGLPYEGDEADNRPVELRLVKEGDPEAYSFSSPQHSASRLPQEVVQAGLEGEEAVWEFAARWREIVDKLEGEQPAGCDDDSQKGTTA